MHTELERETLKTFGDIRIAVRHEQSIAGAVCFVPISFRRTVHFGILGWTA